MTPSETIEQYLATGDVDLDFPGWDGSLRQRRKQGRATLSRVLGKVVGWRARRAPLPAVVAPADSTHRVRNRIAPMVTGLLGDLRADGDLSVDDLSALLDQLSERVQVVSVASLLDDLPTDSLELRWTLANLLLDGMGAPPLSDDAPHLDGFCEDGRAWIPARALVEQSAWSDVVVHETAHLLHELTWQDFGLRPVAVPLVACAPQDQETFAFACELWACLLRQAELGGGHAQALVALRAADPSLDPRVDRRRLFAALTAACHQPAHGWSHIASVLPALQPMPQQLPA